MPASDLHEPVLTWFGVHARDLPWRRPGTSAWAVLVSEVMLQQTPVSRVLPVYETWMTRWPQPRDLAASGQGEAIRAWGRLGYPRRALRLHTAAGIITQRHGGDVPSRYAELLELPGVGAYTAAAVASFGFGQRHAVLDTNVRRVLARAVYGAEQAPATVSAAMRRDAEALVPDDEARAAVWAVALMEIGALLCTARVARCGACPISFACMWHAAGKPAHVGARRASQRYAGTDRYVRGLVLDLLRSTRRPVTAAEVERLWPSVEQRERALSSLLDDGLVERRGTTYALPK